MLNKIFKQNSQKRKQHSSNMTIRYNMADNNNSKNNDDNNNNTKVVLYVFTE